MTTKESCERMRSNWAAQMEMLGYGPDGLALEIKKSEGESKMKYHDMLVGAIKLAGQELIDRAEELVPDAVRVINTNIWIRIPSMSDMREFPTLEVTTEIAPRNDMLNKIMLLKKEG